MVKSTQSVFVWSFYLLGLGSILVLIPNFLLGLFNFEPTEEVWIRVVGMLLLILAYYCFEAARHQLHPFYQWSVLGRASVIVFFTVFVLLKLAPVQLILFGMVDLAGALWTGFALRQEQNNKLLSVSQ
ncbi:MAG: hypothetical protein H6657_29785 [Ardenticatenaceae bacterium]|nr:hypothetical protein [Anaerolineales bacterium]MCB8981619.1 hypothetical protein [Ardenticatenaceae bacterium]